MTTPDGIPPYDLDADDVLPLPEYARGANELVVSLADISLKQALWAQAIDDGDYDLANRYAASVQQSIN